MPFKAEGTFDVTITDAFISEAKFQPKDGELNNQGVPVETYYDVCIQVQSEQGDSDLWRGEMSNRNGVGNSAHLYRADLTLKTLQEIGFNVQSMTELEAQFVPANDRSISIPNLIGIKCTVTVERREYEDRQTGAKKSILFIKYLNALGSGGHAKRLSFDDFMARRRGQTQPQTPAAPPAAPAQPQYQAPAQQYQQPAQGYQQPAPTPQPLYNQVPVATPAPSAYPPAASQPPAPGNPAPAAPPATSPSAFQPSTPSAPSTPSVRGAQPPPAPAAPSPACPY